MGRVPDFYDFNIWNTLILRVFWAILRVKLIASSRDEKMQMLETAEPTCKALWQVLVLAVYCIIMIDLLMCLYFTTLAGKQWHCLSVFRSSKEWSQHVTKDILQVFVQAVIRFPHSRAEKIREGCLISTISTCMRKHHCCKCFSEVAHHEDGAVKTMQWKLALRCRGFFWGKVLKYAATCQLLHCCMQAMHGLYTRPSCI